MPHIKLDVFREPPPFIPVTVGNVVIDSDFSTATRTLDSSKEKVKFLKSLPILHIYYTKIKEQNAKTSGNTKN